MSKSPIKESDIPSSLFHISSLAERCGSVVENTCDACQNSPGSIFPGWISAALPETLLQGTIIDLQNG